MRELNEPMLISNVVEDEDDDDSVCNSLFFVK